MANPFQQWYHADFLRVCKRKKFTFMQKSAYAMFLHELWECQGYLDTDPYELAHQLGLKGSDCLCPFTSERLSDPTSVANSIAKSLLKHGLIQIALNPETNEESYCQERILEDMGNISIKSKVNSNSGKIGALVKKGVIVKCEKTKSYKYSSSGESFDLDEYLLNEKSERSSERLPNRLSKSAEAYHNHNHNHIKNKEIESVGSLEVVKQNESQKHTHTQGYFSSQFPQSAKEVEEHAYIHCGAFKPYPDKCIEFYEHWSACGWTDSNGKEINWKQKLVYFLKDYKPYEKSGKENMKDAMRDLMNRRNAQMQQEPIIGQIQGVQNVF